MAQDYEVAHFKKGDFQDNFGNYWCDMALKGVGEPVRIAVKDPTQFHDGMILYGSIETKQSRAGKDYLKFKRMEKEEQQPPLSPTGGTTKKEWIPRDEDAIRAQWAIGQSVILHNHVDKSAESSAPNTNYIEQYAKELYAMVDRVKAPTAKILDPSATAEDIQNLVQQDTVHDAADEPINLDDIPF